MFGGRICSLRRTQPLRRPVLFAKLRNYLRQAASVEPISIGSLSDDENDNVNHINWDSLGFGLTPTDYMYVMKCSREEASFSPGILSRYGNIELSPSSGILNYGQGLFEGLKAYKGVDNRVRLFRPEQNALRMQMGAERMCMPFPSVEQFTDAVKETAISNKRWIPPHGKGTLYVRPLLMGSGPILGLGPAPEYTFVSFASPVGNYHKGSLHFIIEEHVRRAIPGGTGGVKAITNYAPVYQVTSEARANGFTDALFLDAATGEFIEECPSGNIFIVKGDIISTPPTNGTVLPGITRKSVIEIAPYLRYQVEERDISLQELLDADEVFCTGTAVVINPVNSVTYRGKRTEYKTGENTVSEKLYATLTGIQSGHLQDIMGWTVEIE